MTKMTVGQPGEKTPETDVSGCGSGALRTAETLLRVTPMGLCLAALILTLKNSADNDFGSISYSDLGSFKYLVYVNGLCAGYSIFSAFYTAIPRPMSMSRAWILFFLDQVATYAILSAGAAAAEIVYLAYKGDDDVTWGRACGIFAGFCRKAAASVGVTFGAVCCYVVVSLISSYRLFSSYRPPISSFAAAEDGGEALAFPGR